MECRNSEINLLCFVFSVLVLNFSLFWLNFFSELQPVFWSNFFVQPQSLLWLNFFVQLLLFWLNFFIHWTTIIVLIKLLRSTKIIVLIELRSTTVVIELLRSTTANVLIELLRSTAIIVLIDLLRSTTTKWHDSALPLRFSLQYNINTCIPVNLLVCLAALITCDHSLVALITCDHSLVALITYDHSLEPCLLQCTVQRNAISEWNYCMRCFSFDNKQTELFQSLANVQRSSAFYSVAWLNGFSINLVRNSFCVIQGVK